MAFSVSAGEEDATPTIQVKIGDAEARSVATFAEAIELVRAADDETKKEIALSKGTFKATDANTFRINEPNTTIVGQGTDKTVIDTEDFAVSGQAGILVAADNVTIKDLYVKSNKPGASGGVIKVSMIGDGTTLPNVDKVTIENVKLEAGEQGFGLNLHGTTNATITNVEVVKAVKASVNTANTTDALIEKLTTGESGWKTDIVFSYKPDSAAYDTPSTLTIKEATFEYKLIKSERPAADAAAADQVTISDSNLLLETNEDGTWQIVENTKTGYTGQVVLWSVLLLVSGLAAASLVVFAKKRQRSK